MDEPGVDEPDVDEAGTRRAGRLTSPRAARRRERRRRRRRQVLIALAVAVALTLAVTVYLARRSAPPLSSAAVPQGRTQQTLLVQLSGDGGDGVSAALLAHDPRSGTGAGLLVPTAVLATAPGSSPLPYGSVLGTLGPDASRKALADLLGVTVDAEWVLDLGTAARLVDAVGGIRVAVDVPVVAPDGRTIVLQPGQQPVNGALAVEFATYLGPDEPEQARLARLKQLVDGVLTALPTSAPQVAGLLDTLGSGSVLIGTSTAALARTLTGLASDDRSSSLQYDSVPVLSVDTGAAEPSLRLDTDGSKAIVERLLAASVPTSERQSDNRVLVFNGVGTPLLGDSVRDALVAAGLRYVPGGNASSFGVQTSEVQVPDASASSVALGQRVAKALGLPSGSVRIGSATSLADVVVVVGADFGPGPSAAPTGSSGAAPG